MRIEPEVKLDFADVLIKPKRSNLNSRADVELNRSFKFLNSQQEWTGFPLIAANMSCVGTVAMSRALTPLKVCTALHKYILIEEIKELFKEPNIRDYTFITTGITPDDIKRLLILKKEVDFRLLAIEVANGYHDHFANMVEYIRKEFPDKIIMAGNIASGDMAAELLLKGADLIKCGIGSGKTCITRIKTGIGAPQFSAILEVADTCHGMGGHCVSDGGHESEGDIAKAIGAGSDFVMVGGILAGTDPCEGNFLTDPETRKPIRFQFYGMSSEEALNKFHGGKKSYRVAEGISIDVPYKGSVINVINEIKGSLASTCSYVGAKSLKNLSKCTTFIRVNRIK